MITLQQGKRDHGTVLRLIGDLDREGVGQLQTWMSGENGSEGDVVLDLEELRYMNSIALGQLFALSREMRNNGRRLALWRPAPHVARVLEIANVASFIPVLGAEQECEEWMRQ